MTDANGNLRGHMHPPRFGQKVAGCERCDALKGGAVPVQWHQAAPGPDVRAYCFCPDTPIWAQRCERCGRPPYTD